MASISCEKKDTKNMDEYYFDEMFSFYLSCDLLGFGIDNCKTCIDVNTCTKCQNDYYIVNNNQAKCIKKENISLPEGAFVNDYNFYYCDYFIEGCKKCNKNECEKCIVNYDFLFDDKTKCYSIESTFSEQLFTEEFCPNCSSCLVDNPEICLSCKDGYSMEYGQQSCYLTESFNDSYFYDKENRKYKKCIEQIENCITCKNEIFCTKCEDDFIILDDNFTKCLPINIYYLNCRFHPE